MKVPDSAIIYAYNNLSRKEALQYLGISSSAYYKRLNSLGVKLNKVSKVFDNDIINAFNNSKSIREAAAKIGISPGAYHKRMIKLNLSFDDKHDTRKYKVNDYAFSNLDEEVAYWLGYIAADGSVVDNRLQFCIAAKDRDILENIKGFLKAENPIHTHKTYAITKDGTKKELDALNFKITSNQIVEDLAKYGIVQSKTYKDIDFLSYIPEQYKLPFIFGLFDGDGSISINKEGRCSITISGNPASMYSVKYCIYNINIDSRIAISNNIFVLFVDGVKSVEKFVKLYLEFSINYKVLSRKKDIALKFLNNTLDVNTRKIDKKMKRTEVELKRENSSRIKTSNIPDKETLQSLINQYSYEAIGRQYGVTGKAVRKWCDNYSLVESKPRDSSGVTCVELNLHFNTFKEAAEYLVNNYVVTTSSIKHIAYDISQAKKQNKQYLGYTWI